MLKGWTNRNSSHSLERVGGCLTTYRSALPIVCVLPKNRLNMLRPELPPSVGKTSDLTAITNSHLGARAGIHISPGPLSGSLYLAYLL